MYRAHSGGFAVIPWHVLYNAGDVRFDGAIMAHSGFWLEKTRLTPIRDGQVWVTREQAERAAGHGWKPSVLLLSPASNLVCIER